MKPIIGLFGTCGSSKWRDPFVEFYKNDGIQYFNPLKADWKPEDSANEAKHLVIDEIILIAVTSETYGTASLAEIGFAALEVIDSVKDKFLIVYIAPRCDESLLVNLTSSNESNNARAIIKSHLSKLYSPRVIVVDSLEEMLSASKKCYNKLSMFRGNK